MKRIQNREEKTIAKHCLNLRNSVMFGVIQIFVSQDLIRFAYKTKVLEETLEGKRQSSAKSENSKILCKR